VFTAIRAGQLAAVSALLELGANVEARAPAAPTPNAAAGTNSFFLLVIFALLCFD
jgi:hypothetical protein